VAGTAGDVVSRPEWVKCVSHIDLLNAWCGRNVSMEFHFTSIDHAAENGLREGRLVVCPECFAAIVLALRNGHAS
jgi:hypothetical protein